jgi:hypothetical protein
VRFLLVRNFSFGMDRGVRRRPIPFIPTVSEITAGEAGEIRGLEAAVSYWTEGTCSAEEWFGKLLDSWGSAGFVKRRGDEVLGFAMYGPQRCIPRAGRYPVGALGEDAALLAYMEGDPRTCRHLLVCVMRDLRLRGFSGVEAIASDLGLPRHLPTRFLSESGWKNVCRCWYEGFPYTLMRADFGSTVEVGEMARGLMGRVKLPAVLKAPTPQGTPASAPMHARVRVRERRS